MLAGNLTEGDNLQTGFESISTDANTSFDIHPPVTENWADSAPLDTEWENSTKPTAMW